MKQLNSVIIEGDFQHFTSKKGTLPMTFIINCNGENFTICINSSNMSEMVIDKKPSGMRIVGSLGKRGCVRAEHIEFKPKKITNQCKFFLHIVI